MENYKKFDEDELSNIDKVVTEHPATGLAGIILEYVAEKKGITDGEITFEQALDVFADEFPEFVLLIAEENFMRGYKQGLADTEGWVSNRGKEDGPQG